MYTVEVLAGEPMGYVGGISTRRAKLLDSTHTRPCLPRQEIWARRCGKSVSSFQIWTMICSTGIEASAHCDLLQSRFFGFDPSRARWAKTRVKQPRNDSVPFENVCHVDV